MRERRDGAKPRHEANTSHGLGFEELFERYSLPVTSFFARRGFSPEECRDLTQDTFLAIYKGLDRFRHDSSVETWLFTIAANVWRNELRSRSAVKRHAQEVPKGDEDGARLEPSSEDESPLEGFIEQEYRGRIREALDEMPHRMRRCLMLRIDQQLKYREIAESLQVSIETVKKQLARARHRLRERLGDYFEDQP